MAAFAVASGARAGGLSRLPTAPAGSKASSVCCSVERRFEFTTDSQIGSHLWPAPRERAGNGGKAIAIKSALSGFLNAAAPTSNRLGNLVWVQFPGLNVVEHGFSPSRRMPHTPPRDTYYGLKYALRWSAMTGQRQTGRRLTGQRQPRQVLALPDTEVRLRGATGIRRQG